MNDSATAQVWRPKPIRVKEVYTTGEVAHICHCAPRTVSKWIDAGQMIGYRMPGSNDRRVPRECLVAFLQAQRMPIPAELEHGAPDGAR